MDVVLESRRGRPALHRLLRRGLDVLYPPLCASCSCRVDEAHSLCADCWRKISFLDGACCTLCGLPFEVDPGADLLCAACHADPRDFDRARSLFAYDENSKALILAFKHGDRLDHAPAFARWLERSGRELMHEADLIVPVPLHRWRLWRRRYNQAALLAQRLARSSGKTYAPLVLRRRRHTVSHGSAGSAKARRRNVLGAFAVTAPDQVRNRNLLLVDDVFTTGAVEACARALKRAGAARVHVLTLARVVKPRSSDDI